MHLCEVQQSFCYIIFPPNLYQYFYYGFLITIGRDRKKIQDGLQMVPNDILVVDSCQAQFYDAFQGSSRREIQPCSLTLGNPQSDSMQVFLTRKHTKIVFSTWIICKDYLS